MNPPNVDDETYINFLIATPTVCNATEAARVQPEAADPPAHNALTRARFADYAWAIAHDHRGIKQYCSIERAQ